MEASSSSWYKPKPGPSRGPRRENIRFGVNRGRSSKNNLCIDEQIQEATPEHMRIEIDNIIKEFLDDHEKTEHIFPSDLNNLQRKYIHYKAQIMNLSSKSHGREPNRQLHLKKLPKLVANQSFNIFPCQDIIKEVEKFEKFYSDNHDSEPPRYRILNKNESSSTLASKPVYPKLKFVDQNIQIERMKLPISEQREYILATIEANQVIIISSETGSGKTTQIPQYIMENCASKGQPCKIICTQPRRISTLAAAYRVAYEKGENVGANIGYHIKLDSKSGSQTSLFYCTVGVFLRMLMSGNNNLKNISHVIVDEIHERDKLSDFLLICLKQNLRTSPHLKVILMSATVDTSKFQKYFGVSTVLSIPGRLHSIHNYYLEDILQMTGFFSPQMRTAMKKLEAKQVNLANPGTEQQTGLSEEDQKNFDFVLESYMNFSDNYDYNIHYEEATADLLQLFLSEDVPVDQQHSNRGWTALMVASHLGDVEFVSKLCTMGAKLDVCDQLGKIAYDFAVGAGQHNILQLLDYVKKEKINEKTPNANDSQYLRQLYDMTTPDDFIDYDLIVAVIKFIYTSCDSGAILVFLPGYDEIMRCSDTIIDSDLNIGNSRIFMLHSSMNMKDQCDVFNPLPNQRKIILSTNIAETSITIEDVIFVIDTGKAKEKVYDSYNKLSALHTQWISKACAKQREGRAGRVQVGYCFKLYSSQRFEHMAKERVPEILRVSLEELCLNAKIMADESMNIYSFLTLAPDPPTSNSIKAAIENLQSLGALDKEEGLTRLGEYLAQLTVEPRLGKMLIYGCIFRCLQPVLTLAAAMTHKDPFQLPPQAALKSAANAKRRELVGKVPSDHYVYLKVFEKWQEECRTGFPKSFCRDNFISESTMVSVLDTRKQLLGQLKAAGFLNAARNLDDLNVHGDSWGLVKAIMSVAFFPNIAFLSKKSSTLSTRNEKKVFIHNVSVCYTKKCSSWCFYDEMVKNRVNFMVRGVTLFTPLPVALLCGVDTVYPSPNAINIDDWLEFNFTGSLLVKFRKAIQNIVEISLRNPSRLFDATSKAVADVFRKVMDFEEAESNFPQPLTFGMKQFSHAVLRPDVLRNGYDSRRGRGGRGRGGAYYSQNGHNYHHAGPRQNYNRVNHSEDTLSHSAAMLFKGLAVTDDHPVNSAPFQGAVRKQSAANNGRYWRQRKH